MYAVIYVQSAFRLGFRHCETKYHSIRFDGLLDHINFNMQITRTSFGRFICPPNVHECTLYLMYDFSPDDFHITISLDIDKVVNDKCFGSKIHIITHHGDTIKLGLICN